MDDFWGKKIDISEEVARRQVQMFQELPSEKRAQLTAEFFDLGITQTRRWIAQQHPEFGEREITLEYIRIVHYLPGHIDEAKWLHIERVIQEEIRQDWIRRFGRMMVLRGWTYEDVARYGRLKSAAVAKATISRGLPAFAKLAVLVFEQMSGLNPDGPM